MKVFLNFSDVAYFPDEEILFRINVRGAKQGETVHFKVLKDSTKEVFSQDYYIPLPEFFIEDSLESLEEGFYDAYVIWNDLVTSLPFVVLSPDRVKGKLLTVFHNHQALNKYPNGIYHSPWAFTHTWEDEFKPYYRGGVYFLHTFLLEKKPVKICFNLSPSLLLQWKEAVEKGVLLEWDSNIEYVSPKDERVQIIKDTLSGYRRLNRENVIEIFSSFFAHPIAGYLTDHYGWLDIVEGEVKLGAEVTKSILDTEAQGFWVSELFFSMKLVPVLSKYNYRYIVLDALHHFIESLGDKRTPYEPYKVEYGGGELIVFFRDTSLSDYISFQLNKAKSLQEADANARRYTLNILKLMMGDEEKIVTVALDGENWMILPHPSPKAAVAYEKLLTYILSCERKGYFKCVLAREVADLAERKLKKIPATTWLGSIAKWTTEKPAVQGRLWKLAEQAYNLLKIYEEIFSKEEKYGHLLHCIMQILDSDMYWTEFINEDHVVSWYNELTENILPKLNLLRVKGIEKENGGVFVEIESPLRGEIILRIQVDGTKMLQKIVKLNAGINIFKESIQGNVVEARILTPISLRPIGKPVYTRCR